MFWLGLTSNASKILNRYSVLSKNMQCVSECLNMIYQIKIPTGLIKSVMDLPMSAISCLLAKSVSSGIRKMLST